MKNYKEQIRATVKLAIPIIFTQMGQMLMGTVDVYMVGKLGPEAIGSVAVGTSLFFCLSVFGFGLLSALDFFISKSRGENNPKDIRMWKINGLYFSILISIPLALLLEICSRHLTTFGVPETTAVQTHAFLNVFSWSLLPLMMFFSLRLYLQSIGFAKIVTIVTIVANIFNLFLNWIFIYGKWGLPAMGIQGSALSTVVVRVLMTLVLIYYAFKGDSKYLEPINFKFIKQLLRLGIPAGLQSIFEIAIFSLSTLLASQIDPLSLAAHSIVLNIASFTFMVPLGISLAAAIRVGFFFGEKDYISAKSAGNMALILSTTFMALSGLIIFALGNHLIGIFTVDEKVIEIAKHIIILAAIFQIADGIQVTATGILRGIGNTKASAIANLLSYWVVALPIGYYLCFKTPMGIKGLWMGLTVGLVVVATLLLIIWRRLSGLLNPGFMS